MALKISGKNVDIGQALRSRIDQTITDAVQKFFDGGFSGNVTVMRNGRIFRTECSVHLDSGMVLEATGNDDDANASFDQALERLQKRLRRYKRRLKDRSRVQSARMITPAAAFVLTPPPEDDELTEDYAPAIVAETTAEVRTLSVSAAVMELDMTDAPVVVFRNSSHGGINVVYRRPDGHFGWIDPALLEDADTDTKD